MRKTILAKHVLFLLMAGFIGFMIFAFLLLHGHVSDSLANTKLQLDHKALRVAAGLEESLNQVHDRVEIIALNPLVLNDDPTVVLDLLTEVAERCALCEALLVINCDGSLVAEMPLDSYQKHLMNIKNLIADPSEYKILCIKLIENIKLDAFASVARVQNHKPGKKDRLVIAFLDFTYLNQTDFFADLNENVLLLTKDNEEITISTTNFEVDTNLIPVAGKILNFILRRHAPEFLVGSAIIPEAECTIMVSKPYESFYIDNMQVVLSNLGFYTLLLFPLFIILVITILAINQSRGHFKQLALRDSLTGLYNHRFFQTRLRKLIANKRTVVVSLMMMDLDDFKGFNDTYGHQAGDKMLNEVAKILRKSIRETDIAARYGGEEFAVILPGTDLENAMKVAERIRTTISTRCGITVSIGVSSFPEYASTAETLIQTADRALYKAKELSKDRVECVTD